MRTAGILVDGDIVSDNTLHYLMADRGFEQMEVIKQDSDEMLELHSTDQRVVNAILWPRARKPLAERHYQTQAGRNAKLTRSMSA
ncbi:MULTISPECIES: hypothetical protein [unclassified Pseudomonas]|uniref:hypothetical protein n=1 Tax=unclassified Pseudomonas TaxID=196821 RepID=UPI0015B721BC|nr:MULTISPECIES: hypothetical protein [unclassified Pseudomonas]